MADGAILITGADGYIGFRLARHYLEATDRPVIACVRARDESEFQVKRDKLDQELRSVRRRMRLGDPNNQDSGSVWSVRSVDLISEDPFATVDPAGVSVIVHAAAVTRFNVDSETADRVNVEGTRKLLEFASRCRSLESIGLLSTVYASGLSSGVIEEQPMREPPEFANHYERSKWESESLLTERFDHLPWQIFRVATVIADDESGVVTQQNVVHNTLKLLYYGLLSLLPGNSKTPVYLVTGRFVIDSIFELMSRPVPRRLVHVAHTRDESLALGQFLEVVYETFHTEEGFRNRRILKPVYADEESFQLLAEGVNAFGGEVVNQALGSMTPFARQLFITKEIQNHRLVEALTAYVPPNARDLIRNTSQYLVRTRWEKRLLMLPDDRNLGSVSFRSDLTRDPGLGRVDGRTPAILEKRFSFQLGIPIHICLSRNPLCLSDLTRSELKRFQELCESPRLGSWLRGRSALRGLAWTSGIRLEDEIRFPNAAISLSHSGSLAVAVGTPALLRGIGVDLAIQDGPSPGGPSLGAARLFLTESEQDWFGRSASDQRRDALLRLWTVKEALYKSNPANAATWFTQYSIDDPSQRIGTALFLEAGVRDSHSRQRPLRPQRPLPRSPDAPKMRYSSVRIEGGWLTLAVHEFTDGSRGEARWKVV